MKNFEKFDNYDEAVKAHKEWCKENRVFCRMRCLQECNYCFCFWLEMEADI